MRMVDSFVLPSGEITSNCTSREVEHHEILRFLFVRSLTTVFLASELGVKNQRNDLHVISLYGAESRRMSYLSKPRTCGELEQKIGDIFVAVPIDFLSKSVECVSLRLQKCVNNSGAYVKDRH
jgi:hypothetical protein